MVSKTSRIAKIKAITYLSAIVVVLILVNIISSEVYTRVDLTEDQRYTISEATRDVLEDLDDAVFITVYLEGDLPPGFQQLHDATEALLEDFRNIAGDKIQYQLVDPSDQPDRESIARVYQQLQSQGLKEYSVQQNLEGTVSSRVLYPGATVSFKDKSLPVLLLQEQAGADPEAQLLNSEIGLEYAFVDAIDKLKIRERKKVYIVQGHGELDTLQLSSLKSALQVRYDVSYVNLPNYKVGKLEQADVVIVPKPTQRWSELEKYKLDQYLMQGGNLIINVESVNAETDSLYAKGSTVTSNYDLNLYEDFLFNYGIRVNYNVVQDLNSHFLPLLSRGYGQQQRQNLVRWPYYPLAADRSGHPITTGISPVWLRYSATLDTVSAARNPSSRRTPILFTSGSSRLQMSPGQIQLDLVRRLELEAPLYSLPPQPVAYLVEGKLKSAFADRPPVAAVQESGAYGSFKASGDSIKLLVTADGDIPRNDVLLQQLTPLPLGYDKYSRKTFGNLQFMLNTIDYMAGKSSLLSLRGKDYKLRLLDKQKVKEQKTRWQLINIVVPVLIIVVFGIAYNYIRRRRYT